MQSSTPLPSACSCGCPPETDDGVGFDPSSGELRSRHLGLTSMEERARELGGHLEIRSGPGAGTTVALELDAHC